MRKEKWTNLCETNWKSDERIKRWKHGKWKGVKCFTRQNVLKWLNKQK